jgi:hypothetical protein
MNEWTCDSEHKAPNERIPPAHGFKLCIVAGGGRSEKQKHLSQGSGQQLPVPKVIMSEVVGDA